MTTNLKRLREMGRVPYPRTDVVATGQLQSPQAGASSGSAVDSRSRLPTELGAAHRTQVSERYHVVEPQPLSVYDDNPVFNEMGAAQIVGVSSGCLKKWRQRNQGPDYIQYGRGGPIRYELSALKAFRETHTIHGGSKL